MSPDSQVPRAAHRRRADKIREALFPVAIVAAVLGLAVSGVLSFVAFNNAQKIKRVQRENDVAQTRALAAVDRAQTRARLAAQRQVYTSTRNSCERGARYAAELHLSATGVGGLELLKTRRNRIPILYCSPALVGAAPVPLSTRQQSRYERFFDRYGRVPLVISGGCKLRPCGVVVWRVNLRVRPGGA